MSGENKRGFVGPFKERRPGQGSSRTQRGLCSLSVGGREVCSRPACRAGPPPAHGGPCPSPDRELDKVDGSPPGAHRLTHANPRDHCQAISLSLAILPPPVQNGTPTPPPPLQISASFSQPVICSQSPVSNPPGHHPYSEPPLPLRSLPGQ